MHQGLVLATKRVSANWRIVVSVAICVMIFVSSLAVQIGRIEKFMPYPQHIDERHLTDRAANILKTGDYNPHFLEWPSWPIYLTSASMMVGYLSAASHLEVARTDDIGSVSFPYFTHPRILWAPKILFVLLGIFAALLMGGVGYRIFDNPSLVFLVPLTILLSQFYSDRLLSYPNVDTVGVFSVACLYLFLFARDRAEFSSRDAAFAGALTGMVIASKYSLFLALVPSLLLIFTQREGRRFVPAIVLGAATTLTFLLLVPFSVLDLTQFLDDLAYQANHYYGGHPGLEGPPGLQQLRHYLSGMTRDFGLATVPLFLLGVFTAIRDRIRVALAFLSFPVLHLLFFSSKPVQFTRNVVFVYFCYAFFAAVGVTVAYSLTERALRKVDFFRTSNTALRVGAYTVVTAILLVCYPIGHPFELARLKPDARNQAASWIRDNVNHGSNILVPEELSMDLRGLSEDYAVSSPRISKMSRGEFRSMLLETGEGYAILPVFSVSSRGMVQKQLREWADEINEFSEDLIIEHRIEGTRSFIDWGHKWTPTSPEVLIAKVEPGSWSGTLERPENSPTE
jgi:hypothetical protein